MSKIGDYNFWMEEKGYLVWDELGGTSWFGLQVQLMPDQVFDEYLAEQRKIKEKKA